jgi:hypothetical protein
MSPTPPSDRVTIEGRTFTLGTVYARRTGSYGHKPRRLLGFSPDSPLPGGRVEVAIVPSGGRYVMAGAVWALWAGEPVEDVGR